MLTVVQKNIRDILMAKASPVVKFAAYNILTPLDEEYNCNYAVDEYVDEDEDLNKIAEIVAEKIKNFQKNVESNILLK